MTAGPNLSTPQRKPAASWQSVRRRWVIAILGSWMKKSGLSQEPRDGVASGIRVVATVHFGTAFRDGVETHIVLIRDPERIATVLEQHVRDLGQLRRQKEAAYHDRARLGLTYRQRLLPASGRAQS